MYFKKIEGLKELEQLNKWDEARIYLYKEWQKNRNDLDLLIRTATECWYVMSNWEILNLEDSNYEEFHNVLLETYVYAMKNFNKNEKILSLFGYMISLFPYFFYSSDDTSDKTYLEYERKGKQMLKDAKKLNPDSYLIKVLNLGTSCSSKLEVDKNKFKLYLKEIFCEDTAIEEYFKEVLTM